MTREQKLMFIRAWAQASTLAMSCDKTDDDFPQGKNQAIKEMAVDLVILFDRIINSDKKEE